MSYGVRQSLDIPEIGNLFSNLPDPEGQAFIIHITREGPLIGLERSLFNIFRLNVPYTSAHSRHVGVDDPNNPFGRIAQVCPINFEGLDPAKAAVIAICDNTASGMQHVAVYQKVEEYIAETNGQNNHQSKEKTLLIFSPLLTAFGAVNIAYGAAQHHTRTIFVCSADVLKCLPPRWYFSPIDNNPNLASNPPLLEVNNKALQEQSGEVCSRCNWTASFSAPKAAYLASDEELLEKGTSNQELVNRCAQITPETLREMNINPRSLIPYSTRDEAKHREIDINSLL
jgi:hypothetical protein